MAGPSPTLDSAEAKISLVADAGGHHNLLLAHRLLNEAWEGIARAYEGAGRPVPGSPALGREPSMGLCSYCHYRVDDPWVFEDGRIRTKTNHAGGVIGGITTGEELVVRIAVKPPSTIAIPQETVDRTGRTVTTTPGDAVAQKRHDPCICPRVVPVAEAMVAIVLADHFLRQRGLRGADSNAE